MKSLIVQKYGGSSLQTPEHILSVAKRISKIKNKGHRLLIVVSAMGKTTDRLLRLAKKITSSPSERELDVLLSAGERISMSLLSMALHELGHQSISFTGSQSGIVTDTSHTHAKILDIKADRIKVELEKDKIVIVAGFQGVSTQKEITTLGRGGSDITAVALAVKLSAERCEFYKDVDGIYNKDPKENSDAEKIKKCQHQDVLNLVHNGSEVLHEEALSLAQKNSLSLYLASSFNDSAGTVIEV